MPESKWAGLSEILDGTEFYNSDIQIRYKGRRRRRRCSATRVVLCLPHIWYSTGLRAAIVGGLSPWVIV